VLAQAANISRGKRHRRMPKGLMKKWHPGLRGTARYVSPLRRAPARRVSTPGTPDVSHRPRFRIVGGAPRRWDYFVKNLLGAEPPKEFTLQAEGRTGT